ncbi:MAG TPA: cytochrome c3 family protein [Armatimonadota bacterium]|nr:cytochrome c3 family protein [Armatimonadota bacterium]
MWSRCLGVGALIIATAAIAGDDAELRVLFPANGATIIEGECDLICVLPEGDPIPDLKVGGQWAIWEMVSLPVLTSRLDLAPGKHRILIGKKKLRVRVAPDAEGAFRSHADKLGWRDCADCHDVAEDEGMLAVADPDQPGACIVCHSLEDFELAHFHPLDPIAACSECHALHGHAAKSLLKKPVKELCAACHE